MTDNDAEKTAECLKALGHPLRLSIISALQGGPMCVSEIEEHVGSTQSNVSQHLALLRNCGILDTTRNKNQIYYHVDNWRVFKFVSAARELFTN